MSIFSVIYKYNLFYSEFIKKIINPLNAIKELLVNAL